MSPGEKTPMSRVCDVCGKRGTVGNTITRRGIPKKKGGIGRKITGKAKRTFKANVQHVRALVKGEVKRIRVCTRCIRSGRVTKAA